MRIQHSLKRYLKKIPPIYGLNAVYKAISTKRRYRYLKSFYEKEAHRFGIEYKENSTAQAVQERLQKRGIQARPLAKGKLRIFWVGTNYGQDSGGIIQGLEKFGDTILFQARPGKYGQIWPTNSTYKTARRQNSKRLVAQVAESLQSGCIHVLIGQMWNMTVEPDALNEIGKMGIIVVNVSMDDRHVFKHRKLNGEWTGAYGLVNSLDLACTAAKECTTWYLVEGCPAVYLPEGSDPELFCPDMGPKLHDVSFVGGNYGIRATIVRALQRAGVNVTAYGQGWPNGTIETDRIPELFARSRIVLGVGTIRTTKDFFALKMRDFDGPMSGTLYVTHHNPDLEDLYEIGKEIVTYSDTKDCVKKVQYYLENPDEAEKIAKAGRLRAEKEHTWEKRFEKLFWILGLSNE